MANEILSQLFENQKIQMQRDAALRESVDAKVTNAMSQLNNDDSALTDIENDVTSALAEFSRLANREYGYTHEAIVTDDLEKDYQSIITENPAIANVSAVGMLAVLKDGDTVTAQGNRLFINGEEVLNPSGYTFSGANSQNGIEIVKIWYFQNGNNQLSLTEQSFELYITDIKANSVIDIAPSYFDAQTLKTNAVDLISTDAVTKNIVFNSSSYYIQIPTSARNVTSYMTTTPNYNPSSPFINKTNLKKVVLPELTQITGLTNGRSGFAGCISLEEIIFPKLTTITKSSNSDTQYPVFYGVKNIVIPESVRTMGDYLFRANKNITLKCNDEETTISNSWCLQAPLESFNMVANWGCTINIAVAALNWIPERFTTIPAEKDSNDTYYLYNLLKTFSYTPNAHVITIPQAYVSDDLIDAYINIGWDLLGA